MTGFSSRLDLGTRRVVVRGIDVYQRHLSPRKGFRCAWRVLYGGDGCSQVIKVLFLERSFGEAMRGARQQFALCHGANRTLRSARLQIESASGVRIARFDNDLAPEDEDDGESSRGCKSCLPNRKADYCEFGDCCCDVPEFAECLVPHGGRCAPRLPSFHALDCSALDCAFLDCSFCDCGVCACWPF